MEKLKLAIQKSGRLYEGTVNLLANCGLNVSGGNGKLISTVQHFPMEVLFLRDDDIPQYVQDGVADVGIVGENVLVEADKEVEICEKLGFSACRLSLAVPRNTNYKDLKWFNGKHIATSYPRLLSKFLMENKIDAQIHEISGSVEIATGIGLADGICDIVSTGSTLLMNGLKEVETVFRSEAVLISNKTLTPLKIDLLNKFRFRLNAVKKASSNKYVLLNAPNERLEDIFSVLPGIKSPTVLPLAIAGWSSVHSVISEVDFWEVIDRLKEKGAQGILIVPIEKMVV
ncbi:MAG: ATP phosphoribosyltransferase [Flavobacteriales bacterium]